MGYFNSFSTRIPLALVGAILYSLLTYSIILILNLSIEWAIFASIFVFLFYFGSRLVILFSGVDSPYYSRKGKVISKDESEKDPFCRTTRWVGTFYHYHDFALFGFLVAIAIVFLVTLIIDGSAGKPVGYTIENLWNTLLSLP